MKKINNILKKALLLVLVTALLVPYFSFGAHAAIGDYVGPKILGVSLNDTRSVITLNFDKEIETAVTSLNGRIKISKNGAALQSLPSSTQYKISGFRLQITLSAPLDTADNYIFISEGSFVGQSIDLETSLFDARGPVLDSTKPVSVSALGKEITIKFASSIKGYPDDDSLKNGYISLARNGSSFTEIIPADNIEVNGSKGEIVITLDEALTGSRSKFKIAAGKIVNTSNTNINLDDIITPAINISSTSSGSVGSDGSYDNEDMPQIKNTSISTDLRTVTINFTDRIKNAFANGVSPSLAQTFLKSHISISRGNLNNFEYLSGADSITVGSNYVRIVFHTPLTDKNNYIKFDKEALTDYNGYPFVQDIITDSVTTATTSNSAIPQYASVKLSGNNKIFIYFSMPIIKNASISQTALRNAISISRDGGSFRALSSYDTVTFSSTMMTITLDTPITGSRNRVKILANTLTSKYNVPISSVITTDYFSLSSNNDDDYYVPEYQRVTYDSKAGRIRIYFEDDIRATTSSILANSISLSRNGSAFKSLSSYDAVSISPQNVISILLDEPLTGTRNAVKIARGAISDYNTGYVLNEIVTTEYFSADASSDYEDEEENVPATGSTQYTDDVDVSLSDDFYTVTLNFDEVLYNNLSSLEQLKSKIQLSRNGRFSSLTEDDYIRINEDDKELLLVLAEPADEYFSQIKILPNALRTAGGKALTNTITTLPLGEALGEARIYVNDTAIESAISVTDSTTSSIATLSDPNALPALSASSTLLIKLPDEKSSATLNISSTVVDSLKRYNATLALSFGEATYYLPSANIPTLTSGDTVSITISAASSAAQKLSSAASKDSFSTEAPAVSLSASVVSASGAKKAISHTAFAQKRFMVKDVIGKNYFTVVRIENSGAVVPVPSNTDKTKGVYYLTAKTLEDGNYAAISATHTFVNTPTWVTAPANALASKLILANRSGSDLNANQAISRSETVSIMTKTLGVFGDASGASPFFDMISSDSYFNAVMSAVSNKLIAGYTDGTFRPNGTLTRAEAMTIVARAMRFLNRKNVSQSAEMTDAEATSILSKFSDASKVDTWAKKDIAECVQAGVVNGDSNGRLNPNSSVTRAELIQLMYNLLNKANLL